MRLDYWNCFRIIFFFQLQILDTVIHNDIRHQYREFDIADTVYFVFLHLSSAPRQLVTYD